MPVRLQAPNYVLRLVTNTMTCSDLETSGEFFLMFYVLLYYAARYLKSNVDPLTLANYLDAFFDQYTLMDDGYHCGAQKRAAI
ncbi:hypothetical protein C8T65DRAFT_610048, partial [Cerioporus squamosus]